MTRKELTADIKKRVAAGESSNVIQRIRAAKIGKLNAAKMALGDLLENVNALVGTNKSSNTRIHLKPMYREPIHNFSGRDEELSLVEEICKGLERIDSNSLKVTQHKDEGI